MIYLFIILIIVAGGIITPLNTGNNIVSTEQQEYCGFEDRTNCQHIPQGVPIHINDIQRLL